MSSKEKGSVSRAEAKVNGLGPRPPFAFHVNSPRQQARVCANLRKSISWIKVPHDFGHSELGNWYYTGRKLRKTVLLSWPKVNIKF